MIQWGYYETLRTLARECATSAGRGPRGKGQAGTAQGRRGTKSTDGLAMMRGRPRERWKQRKQVGQGQVGMERWIGRGRIR